MDILLQLLCRKLAATSLPISNELAIIATEIALPANSNVIPLIEKNAAQPAINNADTVNININMVNYSG